MPPLFQTLSLVGAWVVGRQLLRLGWFLKTHFSLYQHLWSARARLEYLEGRYGKASWVVVTNSTTPLGRAFACEFGRRNFNLVLLGNGEEALETLVRHLKHKHPLLLTMTIVCDVNKAAQTGWAESIVKKLGKLDVSALVNVPADGLENCFAHPFTKVGSEATRVNLIRQDFPAVLLTTSLMPRLAERFQKLNVRGAIVTVAWTMGTLRGGGAPGFALQSATMSLVRSFGMATGFEFHGAGGIDSLSVTPLALGVGTPQRPADGLVVVSAEACVAASLQQLGRRRETSGWWFHGVVLSFVNSLPLPLYHRLTTFVAQNLSLATHETSNIDDKVNK